MTGQNQLIDRKALLQNRARRVTQQGSFLHDLAIADVQDRLMMVNKSFKDIVIVTGWADPWAAAFPEARVIEDTDVLDLSVQSCDLIIHAVALHCANDPRGTDHSMCAQPAARWFVYCDLLWWTDPI